MVLNRQELKMQPFSESCFEDPQLPRLALQASQPCDTSRYGEGAFDSMLLPELYLIDGTVKYPESNLLLRPLL